MTLLRPPSTQLACRMASQRCSSEFHLCLVTAAGQREIAETKCPSWVAEKGAGKTNK